ncbi:hypothetical protein [Thiococcus pfennigii]|uniref:hypothetical protein n=1 Tax=Thiococcus pfennigii TaxID=1057 RepID=UPI001908C9D0|nr:hypothetical protein [Thiococcus pfennigii]MBK1700568.1 adenylosuccinate lyase [Thiococcus pfennigii]
MNPAFSERTFEFCFNAEYCFANSALLASHPHIPSQQKEKDLGYDVEFKIRQGNYTKSIYIQHKVSSYAEKRAGANAQFFNTHNGPYFRFAVDNEQHNTLHDLSATKGNAFYCAPRFHLTHELEGHFRASTIRRNAVLLDPLTVGQINDNNRHNVTYDASGRNPTLHSDPRPFERAYSGAEDDPPKLRELRIDLSFIDDLSADLMQRAISSRFENAVTDAIKRARPIEQVQHLLGRVYQVSWLLLP